MRRVVLCLAAVAVALVLGTVALVRPAAAPAVEAGAQQPATAKQRALAAAQKAAQIRQIDVYRQRTWSWQRLMRKPLTPTSFSARRSPDPAYRRWVVTLWRARAEAASRQAHNPPRLRAWLCIHRHERHPGQGWATRTGNGYYGGLQMDLSFQRAYGADMLRRKGTAERWSAIEQIWVAERAYRSGRGFSPWPRTARACGLI